MRVPTPSFLQTDFLGAKWRCASTGDSTELSRNHRQKNLTKNTLSFYTYSDICRSQRSHSMMNPPKSDLPQGTLDLLLLKVATLGPIHGYAIAQRLQQISRDALQVQQGSLYPALHRLENKGFLAAEWKESETGREAKFYRLTAKGRRQLRAETDNWQRLSDAVGLVLQLGEGEST